MYLINYLITLALARTIGRLKDFKDVKKEGPNYNRRAKNKFSRSQWAQRINRVIQPTHGGGVLLGN